jgi:hypothetical protein
VSVVGRGLWMLLAWLTEFKMDRQTGDPTDTYTSRIARCSQDSEGRMTRGTLHPGGSCPDLWLLRVSEG